MKFIVGQATCRGCGHVSVMAIDCEEPDLNPETCDVCGEDRAEVDVFFAAAECWPVVDALCSFARASRDVGMHLLTLNPKPEH